MSEHRFEPGGAFRIGLEEELLLVDAETYAPVPHSTQILAAMGRDPATAGHDLYAAQIELRTDPMTSAREAAAQLQRLRAAVRAANGTAIGIGVHPTARLGDAELTAGERYRQVAATLRGLVARTPECALHIHVGMPDPETAVQVLNGLREHLPLLRALAANSPHWFGTDSGLASARSALVRAYPRNGLPRAFAGWGDYQRTLGELRDAFGLHDPTSIWWDLRLAPAHGTVEVRGLDSQSSLQTIAALGALVQALAHQIAHWRSTPTTPAELIAEAVFRADRDGTAATILAGREPVGVADAVERALARLGESAAAVNATEALTGLERIVATGGGAARRRVAFAQRGFAGVFDGLIQETAAPLAGPQREGRPE